MGQGIQVMEQHLERSLSLVIKKGITASLAQTLHALDSSSSPSNTHPEL